MQTKRIFSSLATAARKYALYGLCSTLAIGVALPEQLPAATIPIPSLKFAFVQPAPLAADLILVHCCHAHPLPPYDGYCCHSGAVVYGGGYYGPAGVVGTSRRVARRTSRRVSRRR